MSVYEMVSRLQAGEIAGWAVVLLILLLSLIQVSPLKINPWDRILGWIGKKLNGETEKNLQKLGTQVQDMWISNHRQCILTFARECRAGIDHSSDEWTNALNTAEEYEQYVEKNHVTNGIITQDTVYLRNLYQELSREQRL